MAMSAAAGPTREFSLPSSKRRGEDDDDGHQDQSTRFGTSGARPNRPAQLSIRPGTPRFLQADGSGGAGRARGLAHLGRGIAKARRRDRARDYFDLAAHR